MKYVKYAFLILLSSFVLASCSSDTDTVTDKGNIDGPVAVDFVSTVLNNSNLRMSRAIDSQWSPEDEIGVYMKKNAQDLAASSIVNDADNIEHITLTGNGVFSAIESTEAVFFPEDGSKVDFVSYYPYRADITNFIYKVDVSDQMAQEELDLMYSDNVKGADKTNSQAHLEFSHKLTKLEFAITAGEGVTNLQGLKITLADLPTLADFNLVNGALTIDNASKANINVYVSNAGQRGEAIILPVGTQDINITFTLGSTSFTHKLTGRDLKAGAKIPLNVTIKNTGGTVDPPELNYMAWGETPYFEEKPEWQYVSHGMSGAASTRANPTNIGVRNFSMLYDKPNRVALWVAYPMHKGYLGSIKRSNAWNYDPVLLEYDQPNLKKSWPSYPKYNRGHQIASSDRTATAAANRMTFYYSNMTLQQVEFNAGTWERLETQVKDWCGSGKNDTLYVVTGVILSTPEQPNIEYLPDSGKPAKMAAVPQYFYKALARKSGEKYYTIGYRLPNIYPPSGDKFYNYELPISKLEEETGFKFFPGLDIVDKTTVDKSKWTITVK